MKTILKSMQVKSARAKSFRPSALASACVLALSGVVGTNAIAQSVAFTYPGAPSLFSVTDYAQFFTIVQTNTGILNPSVSTVSFGQVATGTGGELPTPVTVQNNVVLGTATANTNSSVGSLTLITNLGVSASDGISMQVAQIRADAATTASVTTANVGINNTNLPGAVMVLSNNSLSTSANQNTSNQSASGILPSYTSSAAGTSSGSFNQGTGASSNNTTGSINLGTYQANSNTGASGATTSAATVLLDLSQTPFGAANANLSINDNTIGAAYQANSSSNVINAQAGSAAFTGSAVVSNVQANVNSTSGNATITGSSVKADYRDQAAITTQLSAALDISGNAINASTGGNSAGALGSSGQVLASNVIAFAQGVNVSGNGAPSNVMSVDTVSTQTVNGGLALFSGQRNSATSMTSAITDGVVSVQGDHLITGGSINASSNTVASAATGNLAGNLITADGTSISSTAAAANAQGNFTTTISATNSGAAVTVGVGVGIAPTDVTGTVTLNSNTLGATAQGNLAATNLVLNGTNLSSRRITPVLITADTAAGSGQGATNVGAGSSAANIQGNYGGVSAITATVTGATVAANFADQGIPTDRIGIDNTDATVSGNTIQAKAVGSNGSTAVALSGTTGLAQAGVGNVQINQNPLVATVTNSGAAVNSGAVTGGSAVTLSSNAVIASGTVNQGTNSVSADFSNLTAGRGAFSAITLDTGVARNQAAFGIASNQQNTGNSTVSNITDTSFAVANVGRTAVGLAGVSDSSVTVTGNSGSATSMGNQVANNVSIVAANLTTVTGGATQIGGISNLQNNALSAADAVIVGSAGTAPLIGVQFQQSLNTASMTVGSNAISGAATGNSAANAITVAAGGFSTTPLASGAITGNSSSGATSVNNEFALVNRQSDSGASRSAAVQASVVGIDSVGVLLSPAIINSTLTVQGNSINAQARNNNASNRITFTNTSNLDSGAGILNQQSSSNVVTGVVDSVVRIRSSGTVILNGNLSLTGNTSQALAVGSSASNSLTAGGANLSGNATVVGAGATSGVVVDVTTVNADYGVANIQNQNGNVSARAFAADHISLDTGLVTIGSLTLTSNAINAIAQATSASNNLLLSGANVSGLNGALASVQNTNGNILGLQTRPTNGTFFVTALSTDSTPLSVSNNAILVSAGQNEAFNTQSVMGTTLSGSGLAANDASYVVASAQIRAASDFSVLNLQGGAGNITATANPGVIGATTGNALAVGISAGSVTVNENSVAAKANVNNTSNVLNLDATAALTASGVINNVQTASAGAVSANVNTGNIGVSPQTAVTALNDTAATVAGNKVTAQAGGNTAINALNAISGSSITGYSLNNSALAGLTGASTTDTTFAVLNFQSNAASMSGNITGMTVGINTGGLGAMGNTTASVQGNQLLAYGYGNSSNNALGMSALTGSLNQATAGINNVQINLASISTAISNSQIGVFGGSVGGGAVVVSGNTATSQSIGNSAMNRLMAR